MSNKNSRALDARVKSVMSDARGQEVQDNDANVGSGPHTRVGGGSRNFGDGKAAKVQDRKGK